MKCEYCGLEGRAEGNCPQCGAPLAKLDNTKKDFIKSEPIFYNGYIVIYIKDYLRDEIEVQFWLGCELQERFRASRRWLEEHVREGEEFLHKFWELFLLARGEKEVLYWKDKNDKPYIEFEIRCVDNRPSVIERIT